MSSIAVVKATQGFMPANRRPACHNCRHGEERLSEDGNATQWRCNVGGFHVTALAVCDQHQPTPAYLESFNRVARAGGQP